MRTIPDAEVYLEVVYDPRRNPRSVDWIVFWDNVVLLIEVKSARSMHPFGWAPHRAGLI
jgi:hypothetical protein